MEWNERRNNRDGGHNERNYATRKEGWKDEEPSTELTLKRREENWNVSNEKKQNATQVE